MYLYLINAYIVKEKRERYITKRHELIDKLCHHHTTTLINKYVQTSPAKIEAIELSHKGHSAYCVTFSEKYDGKQVDNFELHQIDLFFPVVFIYQDGIVKLKTESNPRAQIVYLDRPDKRDLLRSFQ